MSAAPSLPPTLRRLLCIQLADIGDLVATTPALRVLRRRFPDAQIDLLTTPLAAPVIDHTGLVNRVYTAPRNVVRLRSAGQDFPALLALLRQFREARYEAVLCFHHLTTWVGVAKYALLTLSTGALIRAGLNNGRGWFLSHVAPDHGWGVRHQAEYYLEVAALVGATPQSPDDLRPVVGFSTADRAWAAERLPLAGDPDATDGKCYHVMHAGSGGFSLARRWEPEKFAALIPDLIENSNGKTSVVLVGGKDDGGEAVSRAAGYQVLNLEGQTTLGQLAAVLARAEAFTGADSGVMHMASALLNAEGSRLQRMEVLFGPSNDRAWRPYAPGSTADALRVHRSGVRCSPCSYVGHTLGLRHGCAARTCMKLLTPAQIQADAPPAAPPASTPPPSPALSVLGVPIHDMTFDAFVEQVAQWIAEGTPRQVCTVNPEYIMLAQQEVLLYAILNRADLCVADGVGVLWAAARLGYPLPERVTGSDGLLKLAERGAREGWRLFLLGAAPGVAQTTAGILKTRFPGLQIAGVSAGSAEADAEDDLAWRIANSRADILFVAFGQGKQDHWIARNLPRLGVKVAIGVGGSFDFVAGVAHRAPLWMQQGGLEWLHRLIREPWRWRRMLRLPLFVLNVLRRGQRGPFAFAPIRRDDP
jgi:N-acetylglucosaminyldiphosphoundecaprenol N-acetyl-beta-D-mannosaminyltransferase